MNLNYVIKEYEGHFGIFSTNDKDFIVTNLQNWNEIVKELQTIFRIEEKELTNEILEYYKSQYYQIYQSSKKILNLENGLLESNRSKSKILNLDTGKIEINF